MRSGVAGAEFHREGREGRDEVRHKGREVVTLLAAAKHASARELPPGAA